MIPNNKMIEGGKFLFLDDPYKIKSNLNTLSEIEDIVLEIVSILNTDTKNIILMYNVGTQKAEEIPQYISKLYPSIQIGLCMFIIRIYAIRNANRISIWVEPAYNPSEYICKGIFRNTENQLMWYKIPTTRI